MRGQQQAPASEYCLYLFTRQRHVPSGDHDRRRWDADMDDHAAPGYGLYRRSGQALHTRHSLNLLSKRNIHIWSSRFYPLYQLLPHPSILYIHPLSQLPIVGPHVKLTASSLSSALPPILSLPPCALFATRLPAYRRRPSSQTAAGAPSPRRQPLSGGECRA